MVEHPHGRLTESGALGRALVQDGRKQCVVHCDGVIHIHIVANFVHEHPDLVLVELLGVAHLRVAQLAASTLLRISTQREPRSASHAQQKARGGVGSHRCALPHGKLHCLAGGLPRLVKERVAHEPVRLKYSRDTTRRPHGVGDALHQETTGPSLRPLSRAARHR